MKLLLALFLISVLCGCLLSSCWAQTAPPPQTASNSTSEGLAQQAADPTAPLMAFNSKEEYYPSFYGYRGSGNDFIFQPVIPFGAWGQANLLRATVNYNINGPGGSTFNNVSVFDLLVFNEKGIQWAKLPRCTSLVASFRFYDSGTIQLRNHNGGMFGEFVSLGATENPHPSISSTCRASVATLLLLGYF